MKVHSPTKTGKRAQGGARRATLTSPVELQRRYDKATASLQQYFSTIDAWLCEHEPDLWRQLRQEDDELFRLRQLGVSESRYQARLDNFIALCERAERLYYEAQPNELRLPPLPEGQRLAIYLRYADGSFLNAKTEDE